MNRLGVPFAGRSVVVVIGHTKRALKRLEVGRHREAAGATTVLSSFETQHVAGHRSCDIAKTL